MGITCSSPKGRAGSESELDEARIIELLQEDFAGTGLLGIPFHERNQQMDDWLREIQKHNLAIMREEFKNDLNGFILNNLLLCVQFFDNFDTAMTRAKTFKRETESSLNEKLAPLATDGVILGERKCFLIHGMGHQLSQTYVYRDRQSMLHRDDKYSYRNDSEYSGSTASSASKLNRGFEEIKNTFLCESILPLEFVVTWDNLEIYKESEWLGLQDYPYSSAKGSPSIYRFCMEEPDDKNNISKGYIRLRCVDEPLSLRPAHPTPEPYKNPTSPDYGYSCASEFNEPEAEGVQEVRTESDYTTSSEDGDEFEDDFRSGPHLLKSLQRNMEKSQLSINSTNGSRETFITNLKNERFPKMSPSPKVELGNGRGRRLSGEFPRSYPGRKVESGLSLSAPNIPRVTISPNSPEGSSQSLSTLGELPYPGLHPPNSRRRARGLQRQGATKELSVRQSASSGYDSMSPNMGRSRSSSIASEDVRQKWRQVEVKKLWQFPQKRRTKATEPLSGSCFQQVEIPVESDSDEGDKETTDSDSDSDTSSPESKVKKSKDLNLEQKFERRTYLDSLNYSSDFCSEFKQIGTQMGISSNSLGSAIVLGTTIRCAVEYPQALNSSFRGESSRSSPYTVLYTFTPSLHSKFWPQKPLIWWKRRMKKAAWDGAEKWPNEAQVEMIEQMGCNGIPLGYRAINLTQVQNIRQTLEWQVGFAQAENILLNSLKGVHWQCLTLSALLFRAFIAPLGPLGIGLEHFRNILYFMCNEEFVLWNEEQPALHLKSVLRQVCESLGRGDMSSFFIREHNMLKNIPSQNVKKVQAFLSRVKDNLLIHCIFALRNLTQRDSKFYPMPKLKKLYKILTTKDEQYILFMANPNLAGPSTADNDKKKKKKAKKNKKKPWLDNLAQGELIDAEYYDGSNPNQVNNFNQVDKVKEKLRRKRRKWDERQLELKEKAEREALELAEKSKLPQERKTSIDLDEVPVKPTKFSQLRIAVVLKFFMHHFIKMTRKAHEFKAYALAAMYVQHIENLTVILSSLPMEADGDDVRHLRAQAQELRDLLGPNMHEYIRVKLAHLDHESQATSDDIYGLTANQKSGPFASNWDFRALPTPPESISRTPGVKTIPSTSSQMARSLQSISPVPRRTSSIKFIDRPVVHNQNKADSPPTPSISNSEFILVKKDNSMEYTGF